MAYQVIQSVEVIDQHPEGSVTYRVGGGSPKIAEIINPEGTSIYLMYDDEGRLIRSIHNCPVVVNYRYIEEEDCADSIAKLVNQK